MLLNKSLFENLVIHYQSTFMMTVYESKVFALLALDYDRVGYTFDGLLEVLNCSKSTLSDSINNLLNAKKISFFYKENSRKRIFRFNDEFMLLRFKELKNIFEREDEIMAEIISDQKKQNVKVSNTLIISSNYKKYIKQSKENIDQLVKNLEEQYQ